MPNIKSAIKRVQITKVKTLQNSMVKTALKTSIKKLEDSLKAGDEEKAKELFVKATKTIDKAAAKGVIHKNTADRKKSSIARRMNQSKVSNG